MGSPKVSVPPPTPEERELQRNQAELLALQRQIIEQDRAQNRILLPFLAQQEGFNVSVDENGNITSISSSPERMARDARSQEITDLMNQRSIAALKGELPVDPALEASLGSTEQQIREKLAQQFGPGYETSTPGIQTLGEFFRSAEILREGARTGQLTLAEQLGITREQQNQFARQSSQDVIRQSAVGDPLTFAGAFGQTASGFGRAQEPFLRQREMQTRASIANAQSSASMFGAGIGLVGSLLQFSDPDMKEDIVRIGTTRNGFPLYVFTRRDTGERMVGVLSTDVKKVFPEAVKERGGYDMVDYGVV